MQKKTETIEDKAIRGGDEEEEATLSTAARKRRRESASPIPSPPAPLPVVEGRVTIRMKARRGWKLPDRELQPGEQATLDEATARLIIEAGYAEVVE